MGRRQYGFAPLPRHPAGCSLAEAASRAAAPGPLDGRPMRRMVPLPHSTAEGLDDAACRAPSRRQYPNREVSSGGSTEDRLSIRQKRHCSAPASAARRPSRGRKHFPEESRPVAAFPEEPPSTAGRRHVPPPLDHFLGVASQVVHDSSTPVGRRHWSPAPRGRDSPRPERRHIQVSDHMVGLGVSEAPELGRRGPSNAAVRCCSRGAEVDFVDATRTESRRCFSSSPTYAGFGVAEALIFAEPVPSTPTQQLKLEGRRRLPPRCPDSLFGGALRHGHEPQPGPKPAKKLWAGEVSLLGGAVRCAPRTSASPCRVRVPKDHLLGGTFRFASAPELPGGPRPELPAPRAATASGASSAASRGGA